MRAVGCSITGRCSTNQKSADNLSPRTMMSYTVWSRRHLRKAVWVVLTRYHREGCNPWRRSPHLMTRILWIQEAKSNQLIVSWEFSLGQGMTVLCGTSSTSILMDILNEGFRTAGCDLWPRSRLFRSMSVAEFDRYRLVGRQTMVRHSSSGTSLDICTAGELMTS